MSQTTVLAADSGSVRVQAFLTFADAMNTGAVLDRDQATRLIRDISAIDSFATLQARRYELLTADNARRRREAILEHSRAHDEHLRLESEHDDRRAVFARANEQMSSADRALQMALNEAHQANAEYLEAAENRSRAESTWWIPIVGPVNAVIAISDAISGRMENAEQSLREARERIDHIAREVAEARSECEAVLAQIQQVLARIKTCDETLARVDAMTRSASEAVVVADAAEHFCTEMSAFMRSRAEDEIVAEEFMTRLDSPIEAISNDGPEPMTGRTALKRLVALAENPIG